MGTHHLDNDTYQHGVLLCGWSIPAQVVRIYVGVYTCAETAYMSGKKSLKNVKNHEKGKYAITKVRFWPNVEHDSWSWSKVSYSRTQHAGPRRVQTHDPEIMNLKLYC